MIDKIYQIRNSLFVTVLILTGSVLPCFAQIAEMAPESLPELNQQLRYGQRRVDTLEQFNDAKIYDINGGTMDGVQIGGTTATGELIVNDANDDADGLGSQGTSGQYLQSAGIGVNPAWTTWSLTAAAAGNVLIAGPSAVGSTTTSSSLTKILEITVYRTGTLRVKYWNTRNGSGIISQVYRNGSAVGTANSGLGEFSEDISGWTSGDLLQIYARDTNGGNTINAGFVRIFESSPPAGTGFDYVVNSYPTIYYGSSSDRNTGLGQIGDLYMDSGGGATTTLYVKTAASTWTAK